VSCGTAAALANGNCLPCDASATTNDCLEFEATATQGLAEPTLDIYGECFGSTTTGTGGTTTTTGP